MNDYLTSWKLPENESTKQAPVTLRRLATHTGGTTVDGFPGYKVGAPLPTVLEVLDGKAPANNTPVRVDALTHDPAGRKVIIMGDGKGALTGLKQ